MSRIVSGTLGSGSIFSGRAPVSITGVKALDVKLAKMDDKLRADLTKKAAKVAMKTYVLPDAKNMAPEDSEGRIPKSLGVYVMKGRDRDNPKKTSAGAMVSNRKSRVKQKSASGKTYYTNDTFFATFLELGTKPRRNKRKANRGQIKYGEHTFLTRALYQNEDRVRRLFRKTILQFIRSQQSR